MPVRAISAKPASIQVASLRFSLLPSVIFRAHPSLDTVPYC
jgi:hypothetical protein